MLYFNNIQLIKQNLIGFISFILIISLFFEEVLVLKSGIYRISITEIIFLCLVCLIFLKYKKRLILFYLNIENYNFFDFLIIVICSLKFLKFLLNLNNYFNLYELLIWFYMFSIYQIYKFLLINDRRILKIIETGFIFLTLLISFHIIISLLIYLTNIQIYDLWIYREKTYLPYMGTATLHFKSLFSNYNHPAHLIIPGTFLILIRNKTILRKSLFSLFFFIVFFLIKSKVLILVFGFILCLYFIQIFKNNNTHLKKIYIFYFIIITFFYFSITHFILIKSGIINSSNIDIFSQYFFTNFFINFYNIEIYGSLFLKLKYVTLLIAKSYNFILFDQTNYYQNTIVLNFFQEYIDPHSEYFGALANYGILGFMIFTTIPIYFLFKFFSYFKEHIMNISHLNYFLIIFIFLIEGLVLDFLHNQMLWIIFAIFNFNLYLIYKKKINSNHF